MIYQLPFRGNRLVEGWQVSGIVTLQSGSPFAISDGFDQAGLDNNVADTRPDAVSGCNPYVRKRAALGPIVEPEWLNPVSTCFTLEAAGTLGDAGRNTLVGPRLINVDFALLKNTKITERLQVQFRAEFFNLANRSDFLAPNASLFSAAGATDAGTPNPLYGFIAATVPNSQREIQFGLKLIF